MSCINAFKTCFRVSGNEIASQFRLRYVFKSRSMIGLEDLMYPLDV